MLLQNYYRYMRSLMMNTTENYVTQTGQTKSYTRDQTLKGTGFLSAMRLALSTGYGAGVSFGTGSRKPAYDDFCLESIITSGLTVTTPSAVSVTETSEYVEYAVTFGVKASSDITISEIGLTCHVYYYSANYSTETADAMMERTVLETPITILAGETKQITYTIRFNYQTA